MTDPSPPVRRRPVSVTFMALLVLMIAGLNLTRFVVALQQLDLLTKLLPISPYYIVLSGLVWGISALWLGLGLWGGRFIAYRLGRAAIVLYLVYFWLDRLLLRPSTNRGTNLPFLAGITLITLIWVFWTFSQRRVKVYFGALHE